MENPRTTSARDHDDHEMLEDSDNAPMDSSTSGGNLARDVASSSEEVDLIEPDGTRRVRKQDDIDNDTATRTNRAR
jgi:hypothetical protein